MINAFETAVAGSRVQEARIDMLADRLSKVNATAFKGEFMSVQAARSGRGALAAPDKIRVAVDFSPGGLKETGSRMDVAIQGDGLLAASDGKRRIYTRGGSLYIDGKRQLAFRDGLKMLNTSGEPINVSSDYPLEITQDGKVWQGGQLRGTLAFVDFKGHEDLLRRRGGDFTCTDARYEPPRASGQLRQGMLEQSNVDGIRSMVQLIEASRLFEASMRAVSYSDRSLSRLITDVGSIPS